MSDRDQIDRAQGRVREGRGWRFYIACAAAFLAFVFVIQNTDETQVKFLFAETRMPLFFALIIAILLGAAIGWLTPKVRGSNRHERDGK
jgi:uncharacterized integral membrane protein